MEQEITEQAKKDIEVLLESFASLASHFRLPLNLDDLGKFAVLAGSLSTGEELNRDVFTVFREFFEERCKLLTKSVARSIYCLNSEIIL